MIAQKNGTDFYGRTGFPLSANGGTASFEWNEAGLMTKDSSRGITSITYNRLGQPSLVFFSDNTYAAYRYSCDGELEEVSTYKDRVNVSGQLSSVRTSKRGYYGNFIFESDTISMVNFPGGYFNSKGKPFYRHTGWQGSVSMVTNNNGKLEQHTGFYPYGEPWREPSGQPYLYGGKERMRDKALNEYDFGARRYYSAIALWTTPDPLALKLDNANPYIYCGANPIKFIDPSGCLIIDCDNMVRNYKIQLNDLIESIKSAGPIDATVRSQYINFCKRELKKIKTLEASQVRYQIVDSNMQSGETTIDKKTGNILVCVPKVGNSKNGMLGHELEHAFQFEMGKLSIADPDADIQATLYDINDEMEAYRVTNILDHGILYFTDPYSKYTLDGVEEPFPHKWRKEDIRRVHPDYERLPEEDLRIKEGRVDKTFLKVFGNYQKGLEYYNTYRFKQKPNK